MKLGDVMAHVRKKKKLDGECWIVGDPNQYSNISIDGRCVPLHRAVLRASGERIPSNKVVMHLCDRKACIRPSHLQVGTPSENSKQAGSEKSKRRREQRAKDGFVEKFVIVKIKRDLYAKIHEIAADKMKIQAVLEDLVIAGIKAGEKSA